MRVAVFVDAGYLYAQGSSAITGLKTPKSRETLSLDEETIVTLLKQVAQTSSNGKELLRIYWYDGAPSAGPSAGQMRIGQLDDVKLRLGQLNSEGQQKGVDSLIVTDLMELARNKAIVDAVVMTGDEDIRVGVQIAQSLGVRVHILGIGGPKSSQSLSLLQEADTITLWQKSDIAKFLALAGNSQPETAQRSRPRKAANARPPVVRESKVGVAATPSPPRKAPSVSSEQILDAVDVVVRHIQTDGRRLNAARKLAIEGKQLPGPVVALLKTTLLEKYGAPLTKAEHKIARDAMTKRLKEIV